MYQINRIFGGRRTSNKHKTSIAIDFEESSMDDYWQIINNKFYSIIKEGRHRKAWQGSNNTRLKSKTTSTSSNEYQKELSILRPHFMNNVVWGFGSAIVVFIGFRISRKGTVVWSKRNGFIEFQKWGNIRNNNNANSNHYNRAHRNVVDARVEELQNGFSILTDFLLSTLIGGSVSLFLSDSDQFKNDVARIPLVEGKSFISDELCPLFLQQYVNVTSKNVDQLETMDKEFLEFIDNCQKRNRVESFLKERKRKEESSKVGESDFTMNEDDDSNDDGISIPFHDVEMWLRVLDSHRDNTE